jgi:hypothetical protein
MNWFLIIAFGSIFLLGLGMILLGSVRIMISAFRTSILWGLGWLFLPFGKLIYLIVHWDEAKPGFFLYLKGVGILALGTFLAAVTIPNLRGAHLVHARQQHAAANQSVNDSSVASPTDKNQATPSLFQKKQTAASSSHQTLRLQGILYNPTRPSAIINGNTVFVGEKVADWSVTAIAAQTVTLQDANGQTNILSLN